MIWFLLFRKWNFHWRSKLIIIIFILFRGSYEWIENLNFIFKYDIKITSKWILIRGIMIFSSLCHDSAPLTRSRFSVKKEDTIWSVKKNHLFLPSVISTSRTINWPLKMLFSNMSLFLVLPRLKIMKIFFKLINQILFDFHPMK